MSDHNPKSPFLPDCLKGKVALITGGGSGIGLEISHQLLQHGCRGVMLCGRRAEFLQRACHFLNNQEGCTTTTTTTTNRATYVVCDVRIPEQCKQAVKKCLEIYDGQPLDILVNGAAGNFLAAAEKLSPKGFATVLAIDTLGTFNMCHASYHAFQKSTTTTNGPSGGGLIVNISATLQNPATFWQVHASAAKAAVDSITRSLALEWGPVGIRVVGIAPGPIANTPGTTKLAPTTTDIHKVDDMIQQGIPLKRMGQAHEIGWAVVYLASTAGQYITGDVLTVDGGQVLYKPPLVPRELVSQLSRQVEAKSRAMQQTTTTTNKNINDKNVNSTTLQQQQQSRL